MNLRQPAFGPTRFDPARTITMEAFNGRFVIDELDNNRFDSRRGVSHFAQGARVESYEERLLLTTTESLPANTIPYCDLLKGAPLCLWGRLAAVKTKRTLIRRAPKSLEALEPSTRALTFSRALAVRACFGLAAPSRKAPVSRVNE